MKVLILGATGSIGRHLVPQALALGHEVTALVRDPSNLEAGHERLLVVSGDALDLVAINAAVLGQEAVIASLGRSNHRTPTTMFSGATRILIQAMGTHGVRRCMGALMGGVVAASRLIGPFGFFQVMSAIRSNSRP